MTGRPGRLRRQRLAAAVAAASVLLTGCFWGGGDDDRTATELISDVESEPVVNVAGADGSDQTANARLGLVLSEGTRQDAPVETPSVVDGTPLAPEEVRAVLDRLPPWNASSNDRTEVEFPPQTLPPPEAATTVEVPFPPDDDAPPPDEVGSGPLEVVRFQPEGEVDVAPFVTVTFNQPMVPIGTVDQLDEQDVPATITPEVEGRWRWIGTRTLRFEVDPERVDRLPAATEFEVSVPAGTRAESGARLPESVSWTFTTPTVSLVDVANDTDALPLKPVFVLVFDQLVEPAAILATTEMNVNGTAVAIREATADEIEADDAARRTVEGALDDRWVAFTPLVALPTNAAIRVTVGPDTPSAEGPLTSPTTTDFTARTFGDLQIQRAECERRPCQPGDAFVIDVSNPLDPESFAADQVVVEPSVPGLRIDVAGSQIRLQGATEGRTNYVVRVARTLRDTFGQELGGERTLDWEVGAADPGFAGFRRDRFTIDPAGERPTVSVQSINHDSLTVTAWAVEPGDLPEFDDFLDRRFSDAEAEPPEWSIVFDETIELDTPPDRWAETTIDLSSAFEQVSSQLVVRVAPTLELTPDDDLFWQNVPTIAWVQRTTLGVDAFVDDDQLLIWTTDLLTGEPVGGVPVELLGDGRVATTDEEGTVTVEIDSAGVTALWANAGGRTALLRADDRDGWVGREVTDVDRWYLFDDRGIYRPGETVRVTGWVRREPAASDAALELVDADATISYRASDSRDSEIATGTTSLNALGGFNIAIEVPEGANLGTARVELQLDDPSGPDGSASHPFEIQEFRRPEFEVDAQIETPLPQLAASPATVAVSADYFAGGPLPDAEVNWLVSTSDTTYQPPNWDRYSFGVWQPWWYSENETTGDVAVEADVAADVADCFDCGPVDVEYEEYGGRTNGNGEHRLQIDFDHAEVDLPHTVTAEATVFDVNRQAWAARTSMLVHPASVYVGLRSDRPYVERGTPIRIDAVVTDIDGTLVAGRTVGITAGRLEWTYEGGRWTEVLVDETSCDLTSTNDPESGSMRCEFPTEVGGQYRMTAVVTDAAGDHNRSELGVWVDGGRSRPTRTVEQEAATVVPDREAYAPGDVAELLVLSPIENAHGLMTVTHGGIVHSEPFDTEEGSAVVELPIEEGWYPNVDVQVELVGNAERVADDGTPRPDLPPRPAFATGLARLSVPPLDRALEVTATPADADVTPGSSTSVTVEVRGAGGEPVPGAGVAVVVVDEAVLSLTDYELDDPLDAFYPIVGSQLRSQYLRSTILLDDTGAFTGGDTGVGTGVGDAVEDEGADLASGEADSAARAENADQQIDVRGDFDALALYEPDLETGDDGTVVVDVTVPDSLTRYRVMAVAVDGAERFGTGESTFTARLPLQVRPSPPQFLNYGDRAELPVVVQNQSGDALTVDLAIQVANLAVDGPAGQRVVVPAGDRIEVRFPVSTESTGTARARIAAVSGTFTDAAAFAMPVYTPATAEAFATYGVVDEGAVAQTVLAPEDVLPGFGGLEIDTSSTALQELTDAVIYLVDYEYESADGYASRIMAISALRDVLDAFDAEGVPPATDIDAQLNRDIRALGALQNDDGGFPSWQRGRPSRPWSSVQATHALVLAEQSGLGVNEDTLRRALDHIASIEDFFPSDYSRRSRDAVRSYAFHVLDLAGETDVAGATSLYETRRDELQLDAIAWLWPSIRDAELRDEIGRRILNGAVETAGAATFATDYDESDFVIAQSDHKTDAIVLDALIGESPDSDLIPKVVTGLLDSRADGRWRNAHENAFVLLALHRYFETFESVTPNFVARAWLGSQYVSVHQFRGRTDVEATTTIPMDILLEPPVVEPPPPPETGAGEDAPAEQPVEQPVEPVEDDGTRTLVLAKTGSGRLYYRLALRSAPSDLTLDPRDEGFVVDRVYTATGDPSDVTRDDDGTWRIAAGSTVRVTVTMVADARRTDVALIDPLPAGLEAVNAELETSPTTPPDSESGPADRGWWWSWFEHQNLRDDRVEAFASFLPGGAYEYTYLARATTPGEFVVPPARAEEIFAPEVFGRSSTDTVIVG